MATSQQRNRKETVGATIVFPRLLHTRLKKVLAETGDSMKDFILIAVEIQVDRNEKRIGAQR
jgi:hypothetical protein